MKFRQIAMAETKGNEVLLVKELMVGFPTEKACQSDPLCHRQAVVPDRLSLARHQQIYQLCFTNTIR